MENIRNRYQLKEPLGEGGMGIVYRAYDRLNGQEVALKRVTLTSSSLVFTTLSTNSDFHLALAHEFRTLASLRHPNIISVLDYGFDASRQPYFTMNVLANARSILAAAQGQPPAVHLDLLSQLLHALIYLHRRGVIHRDLKPTNVLVVDGQVKVLDFGIAVGRKHLHTIDTDRMVGTLAYIAPEVMSGEPASEAADLYAVGVMAYQMITGQHPFRVESPTDLMEDVLYKQPDLTPLAEHPLCLWVAHLLEKTPAARYPDAQAALNALASDKRSTLETISIRESFLQAAQFVGRTAEFEQLTAALDQLVDRQGGLWLVGGESGVGKSRLIDEVRTYALVKGVQVLRGQAISEVSAPYLLWRDVLYQLALQTALSPFEASILKTILPQLENLLQQPIADPPEIEPRAAQERLLRVLRGLFRRQSEPMLVLLEDVQWAREGLAVLKNLAGLATDHPLLIMATYRDDEMPTLPSELPTAQHLALKRLSAAEISDLSASILGEAGRDEQLVNLLRRESEGNVFFIVEVIRALAEDAGQLAQIGSKTLPEHIFTGGIASVIQRRLERVPAAYVPLLELAAISGREIDTMLLHTLHPDIDLVNWLNVCQSCAVLDVQENQWRFAHDKLREGILQRLSLPEKQARHQRVALALEQGQADPAPLAYHWSMASQPEQAAHWSIKAGELAAQNGALEDAITFFTQAAQWQQQLALPAHVKARTYRLLARNLFGLGRLPESNQAAQQGLALLGRGMPQSNPMLLIGIAWQALRQGLYIAGVQGRGRHKNPEIYLEAIKIVRILSEVNLWSRGVLQTLYVYIWGLNLAERLGPQTITVTNYTGASYFLSMTPWQGLSERYQQKARAISEASQNPQVKMDVLFVEGLLAAHRGELPAAYQAFQEGCDLAQQQGDERRYVIHASQKMGMLYLQGKYNFSTALAHDIEARTRQQHYLQYLIWTLGGHGLIKLRQGDPAGALPLLTEAEEHLKQAKDALARTFVLGLKALTYLRLEQFDEAASIAQRLNKQMFYSRPAGYSVLEGYPALVEVYFHLWQRDPGMAKNAKLALGAMQRYARIFAIGKPRAALWTGQFAGVMGKPALPHFKRALAQAEHLGMAYDIGLAHQMMGEHLPSGDSQRGYHLRAALAHYEQIGATGDAAVVRQRLESS